MTKEQYIESILTELKRIRKQAGLSQEEVATRMNTKQAVICRLERDTKGSFSLKRIADYALACGYIPCSFTRDSLELHCIPLEDARQMTIEHPQEELSWARYVRWKVKRILEEAGPPQRYVQTNSLSCNHKTEVVRV